MKHSLYFYHVMYHVPFLEEPSHFKQASMGYIAMHNEEQKDDGFQCTSASTSILLVYSSLRRGACKVAAQSIVRYIGKSTAILYTDQYFLCIADSPGQVSNSAIGLDDFRCKFDTKPKPKSVTA